MENAATRDLTRRELVAKNTEVVSLLQELQEEHDEVHRRLHVLHGLIQESQQAVQVPLTELPEGEMHARQLLERLQAELHAILGDPA